jgi:hypothetical protein
LQLQLAPLGTESPRATSDHRARVAVASSVIDVVTAVSGTSSAVHPAPAQEIERDAESRGLAVVDAAHPEASTPSASSKTTTRPMRLVLIDTAEEPFAVAAMTKRLIPSPKCIKNASIPEAPMIDVCAGVRAYVPCK